MKKMLGMAVAAAAAAGIAVGVVTVIEKRKAKCRMAKRDPEELIQMLHDASTIMDLHDLDSMDEKTAAEFERAKMILEAKAERQAILKAKESLED